MKPLTLLSIVYVSFASICSGQLESGREARIERSQARAAAAQTRTVTTVPASWWKLPAKATWQIQYDGDLDLTVDAQIFDVDGFDTEAAEVAKIHAKGAKAICYFSAGSYENWRPDAGKFPAAALGAPMAGWAGERWLDIRRIDSLGPIMEARLDMCKAKGFDAVDPDNVDGYTNSTGVNLSYHDQLAYNQFLVNAAHARGLAIGLKNNLDQVAELASQYDFAVNEQCFQYKECNMLNPFTTAGKPVFNIEYKLRTTQFCGQAAAMQFSSQRKRLALDSWRQPCQ